MGLIHQILDSRVNLQIMKFAGCLFGQVDSNQLLNGLRNSQVNPVVKRLMNKGL